MYSIRHSVTFIGRCLPFSDDRHYKLCSDDFEQNVIISRRHARIIRCEESNVHSIHDDSMNGVFVNDTKIDGKITFIDAVIVCFDAFDMLNFVLEFVCEVTSVDIVPFIICCECLHVNVMNITRNH